MVDLSPSYFFDLSTYRHASIFSGCTYVWEAFAKIKSYLANAKLGRIETSVPSTTYLINPELISIGRGTTIEPGAYIKGPCIIGENCSVRHGAYIRGDVIVGDGSVIGHDSEVKHSILLDDSHAAHFAYVGDSILGNKVNLGAGTKLANLKLNNSSIFIHCDGQRLATGLRKFGAIIGDGTQIGCNAVCNPGTLLGKGVQCYPCTNIGGVIRSRQTVRNDIKVLVTPI